MRTSLVFILMILLFSCKKEESKPVESAKPNYYGKWKYFGREDYFIGNSGSQKSFQDTSKPDYVHLTYTKDSLFIDVFQMINGGNTPSFFENDYGVKYVAKMKFGDISKKDVLEYYEMLASVQYHSRRQVKVKGDTLILKYDSLLMNDGRNQAYLIYDSIIEYYLRLE